MSPIISLCMIVKNEEQVLDRCLASVKNVIKDIVIVDTGSSDKTLDIAKEHGARIYHYTWNNNFAEARNFAASKAMGKWILVLDADEYVYEKNLIAAIEELEQSSLEILAPSIINFTDNGTTAQHKHTRIYLNNGEIKFYRSIHEQLKYTTEKKAEVGLSPLIIYHTGYQSKTMKDKEKNNRNKLLLEKELNSMNAFDYFNIGNEYRIEGNTEKALECYIKAYQLKTDILTDWLPFCLCNLVECLIQLKRLNEALAVIKDANLIFSRTADFLYLKGTVYEEQGRYEDAKVVFKEIITNKLKFTEITKSTDYRDYFPYIKLASIYEKEENKTEAIKYYAEALNYNSYCMISTGRIIKILSQVHDQDEIFLFLKNNVDHSLQNIKFARKVILFTFNEGLIVLANQLIERYLSTDVLTPYLKFKGKMLSNDYSMESVEQTESDFILNGLGLSCFDLIDLYIFRDELPEGSFKRKLDVILYSSEAKELLNLMDGNIQEYDTDKVISHYCLLIERCVVFNKIDLANKLIDKKAVFPPEVHLNLARLFHKLGEKDLSIPYYEQVQEELLEKVDFLNIIKWLLEKNINDEAYRIAKLALEKYDDEFQFYKYAVLLGNEDISEYLFKAIVKFNDSSWLQERALLLQTN